MSKDLWIAEHEAAEEELVEGYALMDDDRAAALDKIDTAKGRLRALGFDPDDIDEMDGLAQIEAGQIFTHPPEHPS